MASTDFDILRTTRRLREAGFDEGQAEAIVEGMRDAATADRAETATKADVAAVKADVDALKVDVAAVKADVDALKVDVAAVKADVDALKVDVYALKSDVAALRVEIRIVGAIVLTIAAKLFGIFNAVASVLS